MPYNTSLTMISDDKCIFLFPSKGSKLDAAEGSVGNMPAAPRVALNSHKMEEILATFLHLEVRPAEILGR